ncbi:hypothetical protein GCM10025867_35770 [Frondihabitans sucicola]|uniref:ABC transmembrane type-1 domain-containing protein n=1 Tax=Frondihabitans sucicola TaxID=1268041 RepID=A0ABM8GS97_9MICO|nr:ABC transporter permease subunit [Frondihabitans sucicola]BDZ51336.1 hypothetical protein GCM10025867_35770 [Frondihabitans sucicola]
MSHAILSVLPPTTELVVVALLITVTVAVPLAVWSAVRTTGAGDTLRRVLVILAAGMPTFWLGIMLQNLISSDWRILPISGIGSVGVQVPSVTGFRLVDSLLEGSPIAFGDALAHLILPAFVLSVPFIGQLYRVLRAELLRVLQREHISVIRASGVSGGRILWKHALPQVANPALLIIGVEFGGCSPARSWSSPSSEGTASARSSRTPCRRRTPRPCSGSPRRRRDRRGDLARGRHDPGDPRPPGPRNADRSRSMTKSPLVDTAPAPVVEAMPDPPTASALAFAPRQWWRIPRPRRRRRSGALDAATVVVAGLIVLVAVVGPFVAPNVYQSHVLSSLQSPSAAHWFGTDQQGRDIFWRVVVGARFSLTASIVTVIGYSIVGVVIATLAVMSPRWIGELLTRFIDLGLAFPSLVFALGVAAALGPSLQTACFALIVTGWPTTARLLQGIMKETMAMPFVEGARVLGVSRWRLMTRHVLPNALPALWVKWAGDIGNTVLVLGALSFVGAGAQPPSAEWGAMVSSAQAIVSNAWWAAFFPGIAIVVTTGAFGLLGDMLHLRSDPTLHAKGRR